MKEENINNNANPNTIHKNSELSKAKIDTEETPFSDQITTKDNYHSHKGNISDFIDSKDWKTRKDIYSDIIQKLENHSANELLNSMNFLKNEEKLVSYLPKILEDILPQSLEVGLDAVIEFIKKDEIENYIINEEIKFDIFKNATEKAILSPKASCKEKAKEIILLLFELNPQMINTFMKYFIKVFDSNKPKAIMTAQQILKELIIAFGCDQIQIELIYLSLNKLLDMPNIGVRTETISLYKEIYLFKRQELIPNIKYSKEMVKKEIENVFKNIDNTDKPIPDIERIIKPFDKISHLNHNNYNSNHNNFPSSGKKSLTINNKSNKTNINNHEDKNNKNFNSVSNEQYLTQDETTEQNKNGFKEFINKYRYLVKSDYFCMKAENQEEFLNDLENFHFIIQSYINDSPHDDFLIETMIDDSSYLSNFFCLLNSILKVHFSVINSEKNDDDHNNKNHQQYFLSLHKSLQITEKTFAIINTFNNKQDDRLKELYIIILESVIIKYIELEYLNNPNLFSRKTNTNKNNSISNNNEETNVIKINAAMQHHIDELKLNLKYSFLKLTYNIIENVSFKSFLEVVSFEDTEKDQIMYLKIDLISKILENLPFLNIEENIKNLANIFNKNKDRNVKIDSIIFVCLKKIKSLFGNSFEEKLKKLTDESIFNSITEFIKENTLPHNNNIVKSNNIKIEVKNTNFNKEEKSFNKNQENKPEDKTENNIIPNNLIVNKVILDNEDKNKATKKDDLIIIDMDEPKGPPKKIINNKFTKLKKNTNEEIDNIKENDKKNLEEKEKNFHNNFAELNSKKDILIVDDIVIGGNKNKNKPKKPSENNENSANQNKSKDNNNKNKDNLTHAEDSDTEIIEEELDLKKKKEKDLKDFEKMLEEQMLLESKRLEEKGININNASSKKSGNTINNKINEKKNTSVAATNKKNKDESNLDSTDIIKDSDKLSIKNPVLKTSTSTNNLNTMDNVVTEASGVEKTKTSIKSNKIPDKKSTNSTISATTSKPNKDNKDANNNKNQDKDLDEDDEKFAKLNQQEVENLIDKILKNEITVLLNSEKWNERKEGFVKILEYINLEKESTEGLSSLKTNLENFLIYIKIKLKGFKENNFNILREVFNIYIELIKLFGQKKGFDRKNCNGILKAYWEKISDTKLKDSLSNILFTMMEYFTPNFILNFLIKNLEKTKSVTTLKEYAQFFEKTIDEFGVTTIPLKDVVEFCKSLSANTNPQVRNASTSLLCVIYKYIGKDLKTLLIKDIKEATYKLIENELDKIKVIEGAGATAAKRSVVAEDTDNKDSKKGSNILDSLIPRVDIGKKLNPKIIKDLNEGKWADKKKAAETLEKILTDANNKIMPNGLNDLFLTVFKSRLNDGNKMVVRMMVQLITKLIDALGNNFKQMPNSIFKNITPLLIANLADTMQLLREDVLVCMDKWTLNAGIENIIIYIPEQMKIDNFEQRNDLFKYLYKHKELIEKSPAASQILKDFVSSIIKCLQDKTQQIRTSAEDFIIFSLKFINMNTYFSGLKDYKPAIQKDLKKLLENAQQNYLIQLEKENSAKEVNNTNSPDDIANSSSNSNVSNINRNPNNKDNLMKSSSNNLININNNQESQNPFLNNNSKQSDSNANLIDGNSSNSLININNNNNYNEDCLKQDSKISSINYTVSNENLQTNSQILSNGNNNTIKLNSKKISLTKDRNNDKSIEKKTKGKADNTNKTPQARQENNPYSNITPDKQNVSNFLPGDKSKTQTIKINGQKTGITKMNNNINETNLNTTNQEDNFLTNNNNLAGNSIIHNTSNVSNNNSTTLKNESKNSNIGVSPRLVNKVSNIQVSITNKKNASLQSWSIFQQNISFKLSKEKRFEQDKKSKFNLDAPSDEYINKLKENLNHIFITEYVQKLLSDDIKSNVEALNLIINYLVEYSQQTNYAFLEYLDIFLKWIFWKINSNQNPSIIKAVFELFEILGEIFLGLDSNFKLNDIEIYIIVNCICDKLGNTSEKIREQAKELILEKYIKFIIPVQKVASDICNIIQNSNKNAKLRLECLEVLNCLTMESETNIVSTKDMKILIKVFCAAKNNDAVKNKLQEFLFGLLFNNQDNYFGYITDLDPKTKENFTQKFNAWIKTQNSAVGNYSVNAKNNNSKLSNNNEGNTNSNLTSRANTGNENLNSKMIGNNNNNIYNCTFRNINNNTNNPKNKKDFESINKSDDNINIGNTRNTVGTGQYTSRKIKGDNSNQSILNITASKKSGLSPISVNKNNQNNSIFNEDLNNTSKANMKKFTSKIQNVNINSSMDDLMQKTLIYNTIKNNDSSKQINKNNNNNNNNKLISNNHLITTQNFYNNTINNDNPIKNKTYSLEDKEDLINILENLNNGNDNEKVNTILIIHDIIHAKFDLSKHILIPNIDDIIKAFILSLRKLFENAYTNINDIPFKLGKYLITVLYKISSNKELIKNISYDVLFNLSEEVLSNLLIENLDKIGENQEGLVIIRSLNSTMLRVLENCEYTQVIEMLLDIVMKYRHASEKSKISGLGIKCLLKIHQILEQIINQLKIDKLLLKLHLIFVEFDQTNGGLESDNQTDQMIIRFVKNFIYELVKIKKEEIIVDYRLVDKHKNKDKYIKKWIRSILGSFEDENTNNQNNNYPSVNNSSNNNINGISNNLNLNKNEIDDNCSGLRNNSNYRNLEDLSQNRISKDNNEKQFSPHLKYTLNNNLNSNNINSNLNLLDRELSNESRISKINSNTEINTKQSGNNLDALIAYKNKLKEVKDKEMMNRSNIIDSKYASTLSLDDLNENIKTDQNNNSNKKDNSNFYNQINKIKKKWENFSNNSRISNLDINKHDLNRTTVNNYDENRIFDNQINIKKNVNISQVTITELKNKWNQVSNKTSINNNNNRLNNSCLNPNDVSSHSSQPINKTIDNKRKSINKNK